MALSMTAEPGVSVEQTARNINVEYMHESNQGEKCQMDNTCYNANKCYELNFYTLCKNPK